MKVNIIKKASEIVLAISGEQMYNPNCKYKISNFVISIKQEDCILLHSCMTGEFVVVSDIESSTEYLVRHWFLVKENLDEFQMVSHIKKLMRSLSKHQKKGYKTIEIITTTNCNARCYYCYEKGFQHMSMSIETAHKAAEFIINHRLNDNIHIKWYGGEPLMNTKVIDLISEKLIDNGIIITSSMISNGYLFTEHSIKRAKNNWKLSNVRITIDGNESVYNKIKNYKGYSENAFKNVINNIDHLTNAQIPVTIRLNIEKSNIDDAQSLIDTLCVKYQGNKYIDFMLRPLNNTDCNNTIESPGKEREHLLNQIVKLKINLFNKGFDVNCGKLSGMTLCTCIADSGKYIVIKPNGELAYCSTDFDRKSFGSIYTDTDDIPYPQLSKYIYEKEKICEDCPLYPICSPSKLCPSCLKPICNNTQKQYNISDVMLTMKKLYKQYKKTK